MSDEPVTDDELTELESAYSDITDRDVKWLRNCAARDIHRLIAEVRRLRQLCDDNGIATVEPVPLETQPCGCRVNSGQWVICDSHAATGYCPEVHYPSGEVQHVDETGFCHLSSCPIPKDIQDRINEVFKRRRREGTWS